MLKKELLYTTDTYFSMDIYYTSSQAFPLYNVYHFELGVQAPELLTTKFEKKNISESLHSNIVIRPLTKMLLCFKLYAAAWQLQIQVWWTLVYPTRNLSLLLPPIDSLEDFANKKQRNCIQCLGSLSHRCSRDSVQFITICMHLASVHAQQKLERRVHFASESSVFCSGWTTSIHNFIRYFFDKGVPAMPRFYWAYIILIKLASTLYPFSSFSK